MSSISWIWWSLQISRKHFKVSLLNTIVVFRTDMQVRSAKISLDIDVKLTTLHIYFYMHEWLNWNVVSCILKCTYVNCYHVNTPISGHSCKFPGCGTVLILDGNMKNRRDICYAKDAGFIEFEGLPGAITTGCQASPAYKSRYCDQHKPLICDSCEYELDEESSELDAPVGPILRSARKHQQLGESVVQTIVAKKKTRKQTYYTVSYFMRGICISCRTYYTPLGYNIYMYTHLYLHLMASQATIIYVLYFSNVKVSNNYM